MVICHPSEFEEPNMASRSSSSSDSEGSSEDQPKVTTKTERQIRKYQIKRSLILERIFAIEQVNGKSLAISYISSSNRKFNVVGSFRTMKT